MQGTAPKSHDDLVGFLRRLRRLLAPKEVAVLLGKHRESIYDLIHEKRLPAILDGNRWKIDPAALADWIDERTGVFVAPEKKENLRMGRKPPSVKDLNSESE
jgi:excisionase family DNA binding protein